VKNQQMTKYILGGAIAVGFTLVCASSNAQAKEKKMNETLTINGDGAQRNPDIHWPEGPGSWVKLLQRNSISSYDSLGESQAWLRTVPVNELANRVGVGALRTR
jgi:hypothetical protein